MLALLLGAAPGITPPRVFRGHFFKRLQNGERMRIARQFRGSCSLRSRRNIRRRKFTEMSTAQIAAWVRFCSLSFRKMDFI